MRETEGEGETSFYFRDMIIDQFLSSSNVEVNLNVPNIYHSNYINRIILITVVYVFH